MRENARRYEMAGFIEGDPSWFMHQVSGALNQEAMAFVAANLSYGSRSQFMPKIQHLLDASQGEMDRWIREGAFADILKADDPRCFYRLYTKGMMHGFLSAYRRLLCEEGSLGEYVQKEAMDGLGAVGAICRYFNDGRRCGIVPKDTSSACKRICMFLRWMVRDGSPVDLGLWSGFIDRRTLIMPLDAHVLEEASQLGLLSSKNATMSVALRLTKKMAQVFPDDPLLGDFALFGYGVDKIEN